ncbi:MAG: hypothetical protein E6J90_50795 [Deltaproteobacteria bacterium]|nr:MAG: hypothetical protein E6J91_43390 [Deltaproteobacteria bacterium]TMQ04694.1 MAG: hypothetical protein E6J90_50795 [Deltaproteobacteria bacterium]
MRFAIVASLGASLGLGAACSKKAADGLPPATEWRASSTVESSPAPAAQSPEMARLDRALGTPHDEADPSDPHAGLDMSGDPTNPHGAGEGDPSNPHAGLDMSGNPHAGGGTDVTKLGLPAPDPDRPIDPNHRVTGVIHIDARAKDHVTSGNAVFLIVKRAGADGAPSGPPLAVDKLTWSGDGMAFELTDAQAMIAGTDLSGDVVVMARYDQDSDALTKQPGDVTGQVRVKIPADHVVLTLDTVLP